ncbi:MAG: hypothetical protein ACRCXZ_10365, partial [Patescibacteria group bacterium]
MKILIFYTKAGGGHYSAAKNLAANLNCEVELCDLGEKNRFTRFLYSNFYVILTEKLVPIWWMTTLFWKTKIGIKISKKIFEIEFSKTIQSKIVAFEPNIVLSTYFFASSIAKKHQHDLDCKYVVSELFDAPRIWFDDPKVEYIVGSSRIHRRAIRNKIPKEKVFQFKKFFVEPKNHQGSNKTNFLNPNRKTILIIGG